MGPAVSGADQGGSGCPDLREDLRGGGSGGHALRVENVGNDTTHPEGFGRILQQGARRLTGRQPQRGRDGGWVYPPLEEAMAEEGLQEVEIYVSRRQNTAAQFIATRPIMYLFLAAARRPGQGWPIGDGIKGVQAVVGSGRLGLGGDAGGGSGGVTDGGEGGDGWDGDGDGLNQWGGYCSKRNLRDGA